MIGNTHATIDTTKPYVPDQVAIIMNHELQALEETIPPEIAQLDDVRSRVAMLRRIIDMNSLLTTSRITTRREQRSYWHLVALTILCDNNPSLHYVFLKVLHTQNDLTLHDSTKHFEPERNRNKPCSRNSLHKQRCKCTRH